MDKDWLFASEKYICNLRVAAVLVKDGKLLVQRDGEEYALPGGHVKIGETLEVALIREIKEEMGVRIACRKMLWSEECFWEWNGKQNHSISFYYQAEVCGDVQVSDNGEFVPQKDNCSVAIGWMPIEEMRDVTIYPEFIRNEIFHLDGPMKHFVSKG